MAPAANGGADEHEHELPLFPPSSPSPCAAHYYVQSPSAASHTLSHPASDSNSMALILSPFPNLHHHHEDARHSSDIHEEASRLALSRYSSSRGSNTSFPAAVGDNKKPGRRHLRVLSSPGHQHDGDDDDDADGEAQAHQRMSGAWRYVKLDPSAPFCCVALQVAWRVAASAALALLVFVLATRPPRHPRVSFSVGEVQRFALGEGLDGSGVGTSLLTCNSSVDMAVENHSGVFTLRVAPPHLELSFGRFVVAASHDGGGTGSHIDVGPRGTAAARLFVAARDKPMYAAGRGMQDLLLESGHGGGLPLTVTVRARSRYRVVGSLVRLTYRHDARCVVLLTRTPNRSNGIRAAAGGGATAAACSALS